MMQRFIRIVVIVLAGLAVTLPCFAQAPIEGGAGGGAAATSSSAATTSETTTAPAAATGSPGATSTQGAAATTDVANVEAASTSAAALQTPAPYAILMDAASGTVLFEKQADAPTHPSSMSKLMTIYMLFKHLKEGGITAESTLPVSEKAWRMQGSKMFVELGNQIKVEDLIRGIIIQSGNDACIVVAEGLAGTEEAFAERMNEEAKRLGLKNSHFVNATGWPDDKHLMSMRDLAMLSQHIIRDFPEYYHYFAEKEFTYHGITQQNRNFLVGNDLGIDGLKTGHTDQAGYGIAMSGQKDGRRLIAVVNGLSSMAERLQAAEALIRAGFRDFVTLAINEAALPKLPVVLGTAPEVAVKLAEPMEVTVLRRNKNDVKLSVEYQGPLKAPVQAGDAVGELIINAPGTAEPQRVKLVAAEPVEALGIFTRIFPAFRALVLGQ